MTDKRTSGTFQRVSNAVVAFVVDTLGIPLGGAEVLEVAGRKTGEPHRVPVNPVEVDGVRYLFSPRGETNWVKNIRVAHNGTLHRGRQATPIAVEEIQDASDKVAIIRAYLARWGWQVKQFVDVPKEPTDDDLLAIAGRHPVFRIVA